MPYTNFGISNSLEIFSISLKNHRWAKLLARTFKVDVGTCPKCGEDMEIMGGLRYLCNLCRSKHRSDNNRLIV